MANKKYALKISYDNKNKEITLNTLNPKRFTHYGFGTFLENVKPKEVLISESALEALLNCPERSGLQGLEFWSDNRLAWGARLPNFTVPYGEINCPNGAKSWLKECEVYKG